MRLLLIESKTFPDPVPLISLSLLKIVIDDKINFLLKKH